jgi:hypothetical protein
MMSEIPWDIAFNVIIAVVTLVSVIAGVFLSGFLESRKDKKRIAVLKKALHSELETIKKTLSSAEPDGAIKAEDFPLITKIYDSVYVELASVLNPDQLVALHRAYEEIKKLNQHPRTVANYSGYLYEKNDLKKVHELIANLKGI